MTIKAPPVRRLVTEPKHENFYNSVMASAVTNGLSDAEIVAVLAVIIGRMVGSGKHIGTDEDYQTLLDTAIFNLRLGSENAAKLIAALKSGAN